MVNQEQYIELLQTVRNDAYKLGYIDGKENAKADNAKHVEMLQNEIHFAEKRAAWLQNKYARMKENYENQIVNLQNKIKHYEDMERRC